jgi:DNA-binding Lrp family transcriptional regulator
MTTQDLRILQHLRRDARINLTVLSKKTGIPVSTLFDRLRAGEGSVITRFTVLMDFAKLGFPVRTKVLLRADAESRVPLRNYLLAHNRVNGLWRINNGFDYAADCFFASIKEAEEFLDTIEEKYRIVEKQMFHIIDDLATEKAMTVDAAN